MWSTSRLGPVSADVPESVVELRGQTLRKGVRGCGICLIVLQKEIAEAEPLEAGQ